MNISIEFSRALRIISNRYPIYILILLFSFLLQREILVDIPMSDDRLPLKITDTNVTVNAFVHSFVLVFVIFLIEIFYKECL